MMTLRIVAIRSEKLSIPHRISSGGSSRGREDECHASTGIRVPKVEMCNITHFQFMLKP
jgi:hypothetical protein